MVCPQCQQSVRDGARFCDSCGLSIGSIAAANQSPTKLAETVKAVDPLIGHVIDSKYQLIEQVVRGGSWLDYASVCRSALRDWIEPDLRYSSVGFRVVAVVRTQ